MKVLVFRIGQLGDTIIALPAMWAIRQHFKTASLTLLCDHHPGEGYVPAADLLLGTGIFDSFECYPVERRGFRRWLQPFRIFLLLRRLRREKFAAVVYLAPSIRSAEQLSRDRQFFRLAGISTTLGMDNFPHLPVKLPLTPLEATPSEADLLMARLSAAGIPVPPSNRGCMSLGLSKLEEEEVSNWQRRCVPDGNRVWTGFGPGSKMDAKRWSIDRFREVGQELIEDFDIWPVVFGGPEDKALGDQLIASWGRGYNAAGQLCVRAAAAALKMCRLYVGNDTGTMHLAAAVGTPCVAIFSAREWPGMWFPYGNGHEVLRAQIECEGCALTECVEYRKECLDRIQVSDVVTACVNRLNGRLPARNCNRAQSRTNQLCYN